MSAELDPSVADVPSNPTSDSFEYPLAAGVAANAQLPALNTLAPNAFSVADMGTCEDAKTLLQEAQLL